MRTFIDILGQTLRTLWAHKLRSLLTMFGIAWGVGSLLLLIGLGEGFRSGNRRQLNQIGEDVMFMFPGHVPVGQGGSTAGRPYFLTYKDVQDIRAEAKLVDKISPVLQRYDLRALSDYGNSAGVTLGVEPLFNVIRYLPLSSGRWLNEEDELQHRKVAVISWEMLRALFPGRPALGEKFSLNGIEFEVVGVLENVGRGDQGQSSGRAFVPYRTMDEFFPMTGDNVPPGSISFINFRPVVRDLHVQANDQVRRIVARNHNFDWRNDDAFEAWDTVENAEMVGKIFTAMDWFLGSVGIVTLALGGIGVVNIMLVSVTERTKEIGLRKALGATQRSILAQFFLEAITLTLLSGLIGLGAAALLMWLFSFIKISGPFDPPTLVPWSAALAIGSLTVAGVLAGLYPARKAAMLEPVEALRKE